MDRARPQELLASLTSPWLPPLSCYSPLMASPSHGLINWSWWPLRRSTVIIFSTLVGCLAADFVFVRALPLATFIAMLVAAPYAILFILGFPVPPGPRERFRHRPPPAQP